ncbi:MAG: homoserine O-acetyltransferase [Burkholderiales bacterium]|nr:homoserine O-acetyltransferase [Burkholderiales bacterium]
MQRYEGLVEKRIFSLPSHTAVNGRTIKDVKIGWESYGQLNDARDNVILVPHHYSSNSHAAGRYKDSDPLPGYWDSIIGPGKPLDTDRFFVMSVDSLVNMNSKDGITVTTGPASIDADTGKPYGMQFPVVTIRDFVRVQKALIDSLGIQQIHACVGVSMGALQSYEWAAAYPELVKRVVAINGSPAQRPFALCNLDKWVAPIRLDPNWKQGDYYGGSEPIEGLTQAFCNVLIDAWHPQAIAATYQHQWAVAENNPLHSQENDFLVNQSFRAVGLARATCTTDANNMLYMTRANQLFIAGTPGSSVDAELKNIRADVLVIQAWSDLLFPIADARMQVEKLLANGTRAEFRELDSAAGHIGGVTEVAKEGEAIRRFLNS